MSAERHVMHGDNCNIGVPGSLVTQEREQSGQYSSHLQWTRTVDQGMDMTIVQAGLPGITALWDILMYVGSTQTIGRELLV